MRVLLLGSTGYLGEQFRSLYPDALCPRVDIGDASAVSALLDEAKPDLLINAAGKTGRPNVDWCETHKVETLRANVTGPLVLQSECSKRGIEWVHVSSGCIYEGDNGGRGYGEDDPPNFAGSYYARTKALAEAALREFPVLILRLRMPFDGSRHERNLITKLSRYPRVLDVKNSITYLPDFLDAASKLIQKRAKGIYNIVNPRTISPYEIMQRYQHIVDPRVQFERLTEHDLPAVVRAGRSNCILSGEKLSREGITLRPVEDALDDALNTIAAATLSLAQ